MGFSARDIDADWLPVTDFVEKPVDLALLVNKVSALLQRGASAARRSDRAE
jgi:DNA-binding response OmpR family regulator